MYFNGNNNRSGHLFEYAFKAKTIGTDEVLLHVSRYIHLNPVMKNLVEHPIEWRWSSYQEYFDPEIKPICDTQEILGYFTSPDRYKSFVEDTQVYKTLINEIEIEKMRMRSFCSPSGQSAEFQGQALKLGIWVKASVDSQASHPAAYSIREPC